MINLDTAIELLCKRIEGAKGREQRLLRGQLIRTIVFRRNMQPSAPMAEHKKRATRKSTGSSTWCCADCGRNDQRSLKNDRFCRGCARWQAIGGTG